MKQKRHARIIEIIENNTVKTQEALQQLLFESGYNITQATISRDIKELRLIKTLSEDGEYKYSIPKASSQNGQEEKFKALFSDSVLKIDYAINTVVVKCKEGMANAVCATLDTLDFKNIVGTLAGDNTIFIIMRTEENAKDIVQELQTLF